MRLLLVIPLLLLAATAHAQQADPRVAPELIQALQAQLVLVQAMARVQQDDATAALAAYGPAVDAHRWATNPLWRLK